ncbi:hypothetical protein OAM69_07710 [bacterium]|nr:hypothetical protein [bacterium]
MTQYRSPKQRITSQLTVMVLSALVLAGCSTRQIVTELEGSTAQRLVTFSIDKFIKDLADLPEIKALKGKTVHLGVHFLKDHQLLGYTTRLLNAELQIIHEIKIADAGEPADFDLDVFFNSMGTDNDTFGLSIPTLGFVTTPDATIDILALDMFHGITEGYAIVQDDAGSIVKTDRVLARIRRDNVSTPIINFPLNQLD